MKIFGITIITKKELKEELAKLREQFPFDIGQIVYDIQLKNEKGKSTRVKPSRVHSFVSEVVVDTKNYFNLVKRFQQNDVFIDPKKAYAHLDCLCVD